MNNQKKTDFYLHSIMCLIGGFMGGYAILNRCGNLGSAQTANLIYIVTCFLGHNLSEFFVRILGAILYFAAIELYVYITHKTQINVQRYGILVLIFGSIILNFIPTTADPVVGLLPLFFIMATQWSIFHGTNGYNSSTIFSTNNFRQAALAIGDYLCTKDKKYILKAKFFGNSLLWYHLGVMFSFFICKFWGIHAVLFCLIPESYSFLLTYKNKAASSIVNNKAAA